MVGGCAFRAGHNAIVDVRQNENRGGKENHHQGDTHQRAIPQRSPPIAVLPIEPVRGLERTRDDLGRHRQP
jgi:hypothetical protein